MKIKRMLKRDALKMALVSCSLNLVACDYVKDASIAERFVAKNVCTGYFVSHYNEDDLINKFTLPFLGPKSKYLKISIDKRLQQVHVSDTIFKELFAADAIYRPPFGCVLRFNESTKLLRKSVPTEISVPQLNDEAWPTGSGGLYPTQISGVNYDALQKLSDQLMASTEGLNAAAYLVIYDQKLVFERYGSGASSNTRLKGFSASKSAFNSVVGALWDRGQIDIRSKANYAGWAETPKAEITIENLLQMTSGLIHNEVPFGENNDQGQVMYGVKHPATLAASKQLAAAPGTVFNYSSGDTAILADVVQKSVGSMKDIYSFYQHELFFPAGITSGLFEFDTKNYINAPEAAMMTAQDWARLGWLYVDNGRIDGKQVLSEDWIRYSLTPSSQNPDYGSSIVLNTSQKSYPDLPADAFVFEGIFGQAIIGIPSRRVIIVRLGYTFYPNIFDINAVAAQTLTYLPNKN